MSVPRSARARALIIFLLGLVPAQSGLAFDLDWPDGAVLVRNETPVDGSLRVATGPFDGDAVPVLLDHGLISGRVWHIPGNSGDPSRIEALILNQLRDQGYEIVFACQDRHCGGFDFRHAMPIASGPDMLVDLGNYRYVAARRTDDIGTTLVAVTLSQGGQTGYAHVAVLSPQGSREPTVVPSSRLPDTGGTAGSLIERLTETGRAPLDDLRFDTGAATLSTQSYDSLTDLAAFLAENPARQVVLVGHTDAEGGLDGNIRLSQARASAVRDHLIETLGVTPDQVRVEGIGFLAPRAPNTSAEGREANRRVEVVLILP